MSFLLTLVSPQWGLWQKWTSRTREGKLTYVDGVKVTSDFHQRYFVIPHAGQVAVDQKVQINWVQNLNVRLRTPSLQDCPRGSYT